MTTAATGPVDEGSASRTARPPALALTGVVAGYGGRPVLRGVDLIVGAGRTTAVLGPSGCGKTTLLRVVAGFVPQDSGHVELHGRHVAGPLHSGRWEPPESRSIGYVAQEGALFPHLSVADNITFGLPRATRRNKAAASAQVHSLLELVHLDTASAARRPQELSGGQQQRVALARALARGPGLVLLDEPFSALDAGLRAGTRAAVKDALTTLGVAVVLVTHDQDEALSFADEVAVMRDGRVIQIDTPTAVYERPVDLGAAEFLGEAVILSGHVDDGVAHCALGTVPVVDPATGTPPADGPVDVVLRPEQLLLHPLTPATQGGGIGVVERESYFGHDVLVAIRLRQGDLVTARLSGPGRPSVGDPVLVTTRGTGVAYPGRTRSSPDDP